MLSNVNYSVIVVDSTYGILILILINDAYEGDAGILASAFLLIYYIKVGDIVPNIENF
jgi:hypothetical protein